MTTEETKAPEGAPKAALASKPKGKTIKLVVVHGTYVGDGCPDKDDRKREKDRGFDYDHTHPAVPGEILVGLSEADAARLIKTRCFKKPEDLTEDDQARIESFKPAA